MTAQRRRKKIATYYNYASTAFIAGGVGIYVGITIANWR